ncbi:MAG: type I restriction-modification system subunit M N-terminal domain-containing protein, partial [Deinococcus sp.]
MTNREQSKARRSVRASVQVRLEELLWNTADQLRGHTDAAEYKHVVLGLIFLKYISDSFQRRHDQLTAEYDLATAEDRDEYTAEGIFWVPREARWDTLKAAAKQDDIGRQIDDAMKALERENPKQLKDMLPKNYARPSLPARILSGLIDEISKYGTGGTVPDTLPRDLFSGDMQEQAEQKGAGDLLGKVYQYMLGRFAAAEGKLGGEFYTP